VGRQHTDPNHESAVLSATHALDDGVNAALCSGSFDELVVGPADGGERGDEEVEVETANQLEAVEIALAVAVAVEGSRSVRAEE
jgi:hypothetical protein